MSEYVIGWTAVGSLLGLTVACAFYMLGGRHDKWQRRYLGSLALMATVNISAYVMGVWSSWLLVIFPCLVFGFSLGYGAESVRERIIRRTIYALGCCLAGLQCCFVLGGNAWLVLVPHLGTALWSIYLGTKNPLYAAAEEVFVCASLNLGLCMYPFMVIAGR